MRLHALVDIVRAVNIRTRGLEAMAGASNLIQDVVHQQQRHTINVVATVTATILLLLLLLLFLGLF